MALLDGFQDLGSARDRAERAMLAPIGMMSPLWIAFGVAASAGAAWWWMTRWAKPVNLEAPISTVALIAETGPDDLTQLSGVGPKVAKALNEHGVTTFAQLAAWSAEELAAFDAASGLKGNTVRAGIVEQAKALAGA
jgi:large subunit ribosomal protein L21